MDNVSINTDPVENTSGTLENMSVSQNNSFKDAAGEQNTHPAHYVKSLEATVDMLKQREAALNQFIHDLKKENPASFLQAFQENPQAVLQEAVSSMMSHQQEIQTLEREYAEKYPELLPFRDEVLQYAIYESDHAERLGKPVDSRAALDAGIQNFRIKLNQYMQVLQRREQQARLRQQTLQFDSGYSETARPFSLSEQLRTLKEDDDATFIKIRSAYLKSKGISI
jgi:hypothetical protein